MQCLSSRKNLNYMLGLRVVVEYRIWYKLSKHPSDILAGPMTWWTAIVVQLAIAALRKLLATRF